MTEPQRQELFLAAQHLEEASGYISVHDSVYAEKFLSQARALRAVLRADRDGGAS
jgi:hypothetical protein